MGPVIKFLWIVLTCAAGCLFIIVMGLVLQSILITTYFLVRQAAGLIWVWRGLPTCGPDGEMMDIYTWTRQKFGREAARLRKKRMMCVLCHRFVPMAWGWSMSLVALVFALMGGWAMVQALGIKPHPYLLVLSLICSSLSIAVLLYFTRSGKRTR